MSKHYLILVSFLAQIGRSAGQYTGPLSKPGQFVVGLKLGSHGAGIRVEARHPTEYPEDSHKRRDFKLNAKIIQKYGYSIDCPGCEKHALGLPKAHHSVECRRRIEDDMLQDDEEKRKIKLKPEIIESERA